MTKLLAAYRKEQTDANLAKLNKHIDKHPMAGLYLTKDDIALIANHK